MSSLRPKGVPYPDWVVARILACPDNWSNRAIASVVGVSPSTVSRVLRRRSQDPNELNGRRNRRFKLTEQMAGVLFLLLLIHPQITLLECQSFLETEKGVRVSLSTICRELQRLGFTRKKVQHFSCKRNEERRVQWWTEPPSRGGCFGVDWRCMVDIDESHIRWGDTRRQYGHSLVGVPARYSALVSVNVIC